ncbi:MAG: glycerol-3-phosphate acyltransferase [Dehalococcoidia bacterium]|nr:glycerol-3-phosphate acyltransferase [Dehalococcoidia bacterium]
MLVNLALLAGSYLYGALPFTVALARMSGLDLSQEKDLHIALWHRASKKRAFLAVFVDFIKGVIPVLVGFGFGLPSEVVAFSGVAAIAGQMWPPPRGSHGEKGNSVGAGVVITLALVYQAYFTLFALVFFAGGAVMRYITLRSDQESIRSPRHPLALALPVGMLLGFVAAPVASWWSGQPQGMTLGLLALLIIILVRRLTAELKADLEAGGGMAMILVRRLVFDQSFAGGIEE